MRILVVTPWFPSVDNPTSGVFVLRDALALSVDHEVTVVHLDAAPSARGVATVAQSGSVRVIRQAFRRSSPLAWRRVRVRVAELARDADVVHTHAFPALLPYVVGSPAQSAPWVHTEHWSGITAPETLSFGLRVMRRLLMRLLAKPDVVVSAAERLSRAIRSVRPGPIAYVPCVVSAPERVVAAPRDPALLRLVGVGGIVPRKGPLLALEAVAELSRRGVTAHLTWVGEGSQRSELEAAAERLGLSDRLTLTGTLDEAGVGQALDTHDLFILPTMGDNFCIVAAEALSHGRPIVSGAETGAVDYSDPSVSEFVTERSAVAYADAVARVRDKTAQLTAQDVADTVRGEFSPERVAGLLTAVYTQAGARSA